MRTGAHRCSYCGAPVLRASAGSALLTLERGYSGEAQIAVRERVRTGELVAYFAPMATGPVYRSHWVSCSGATTMGTSPNVVPAEQRKQERDTMHRFTQAREAYLLGRRLQAAIERGRKLHPWEDARHSLAALDDEVQELRLAVASGNAAHAESEAIDVCVVALRTAAGR